MASWGYKRTAKTLENNILVLNRICVSSVNTFTTEMKWNAQIDGRFSERVPHLSVTSAFNVYYPNVY